jgi:hypothetical protein
VLAQNLPGDDVRVILHGRDDDLVTGLQPQSAVAVCRQVDGVGGPADEDDLPLLAGAEKLADLSAGAFLRLRRPLTERVQAAVDVGVVLGARARHRVDHHLRLLRARNGVQVDQRLPVNSCRKMGKSAGTCSTSKGRCGLFGSAAAGTARPAFMVLLCHKTRRIAPRQRCASTTRAARNVDEVGGCGTGARKPQSRWRRCRE